MSEHSKSFDNINYLWNKDPEINRLYIQTQQNWANQQLKVRGHIFLNEVYDMFGLDRTSVGQLVGWFRDDDQNNYVHISILEENERSMLLDFNPGGVIYHRIEGDFVFSDPPVNDSLGKRYLEALPDNVSVLSMQQAFAKVPDEIGPELMELIERVDVEALIRIMEILPQEVMNMMFQPPDINPSDFEETN